MHQYLLPRFLFLTLTLTLLVPPTLAAVPRCIRTPPARRSPLASHHCSQLVRMFQSLPDQTMPRYWTASGFLAPMRFSYQTCELELTKPREQLDAFASYADVADGIRRLQRGCVSNGPGAGGQISVGPVGELMLEVGLFANLQG